MIPHIFLPFSAELVTFMLNGGVFHRFLLFPSQRVCQYLTTQIMASWFNTRPTDR
jgi:hypothetical protein